MNESFAVMVSLNAVPAAGPEGVDNVKVAAVAGDTTKELEVTALATPVMPLGVAVNVYVPAAVTWRLEKVATPLLMPTVVGIEVKVPGPVAMDMTTEPLLVDVATLPKASRACTTTLGMALPAVPGPGGFGLKTRWVAAPPVTVSDWVSLARAPEAVIVGSPALVSP